MNKNRFIQLKELTEMGNIQGLAKDLNYGTIKDIWKENLEKYIKKFIEDLSINDIENLYEKIREVWWIEINKSVSITKNFYKILTEYILLPDYLKASDWEEKIFKELDEIILRAENRANKIMNKINNKNWFFSIYCPNIDNIYKEFENYWNMIETGVEFWWIFWRGLIENATNWFFNFTIPIRTHLKWEENYSNLKTISKENLENILKEIIKTTKNSKKFKELFKWNPISVEIFDDVNKMKSYWVDENQDYKIIKIFINWESLNDDMHPSQMKNIIDSVFEAWSFLINKIAKDSWIEHKNRTFIFQSGSYIERENLNLENNQVNLNNQNKDHEKTKYNSNSRSAKKFESMKINLDDSMNLEQVWWQTEAKKTAEKIIKSIRHEEIMKSWWAKMTKWIIFEWPAGTGKTLLAKVIASQIDADIYNVKLTDIASSAYINEWANNLKDLFNFIRNKSQKSEKKIIVILDELDGLFSKRWKHNQEDTKIVNTFLTELDWFEQLENVIFIWTTNRIEEIDPAVIRSGRLWTKIKLDLPNKDWIKQIYEIHITKLKNISKKFTKAIGWVNLDLIVEKSIWLSWADIEEIIRIIAEEKAMQEIDTWKISHITEKDFFDAIEKIKKWIKTKNPIWFTNQKS